MEAEPSRQRPPSEMRFATRYFSTEGDREFGSSSSSSSASTSSLGVHDRSHINEDEDNRQADADADEVRRAPETHEQEVRNVADPVARTQTENTSEGIELTEFRSRGGYYSFEAN